MEKETPKKWTKLISKLTKAAKQSIAEKKEERNNHKAFAEHATMVAH